MPGLDRDELTRAWGDVIFPALPPGVRSVFRTGRWVAVEGGGTAVFAFEHPQFLQRGEERRLDVEAALAGHFGAPVGLRLVLDPSAPPPAGRTTSPAAARSASPGGPRGARRPAPGAPAATEAPPYEGPLPDQAPGDEVVDISAEEFAQLEPAPDGPATAEALLLQAFPGTEEVAR